METPAPYYFAAPPPSFDPDDGQPTAGPPRQRRFTGTAYTGDRLPWWNGSLVIDLASLILPERCPVLLNNERDDVTSHCTLTVSDNTLLATGLLLTNEYGLKVAAAAD